jgi:methionine aminotransferase
MPHLPFPLVSRLPAVGTTIFTTMSRLAQECGAINLSQGFPDFSAEDVLFERSPTGCAVATTSMRRWRACRPAGGDRRQGERSVWRRLRPRARDYRHGRATQALFTAVAALVHPGDEVIVFEPVYDSYVPAIELQGGVVRRARLRRRTIVPTGTRSGVGRRGRA